MLLKIAINGTKCLTVDVLHGKSVSTRTAAVKYLGHHSQITDALKLMRLSAQVCALFWEIT